MINIAMPKGRLALKVAQLLEKAGLIEVDLEKIDEESRKLVLEFEGFKLLLVKPFDVPTYVEHGVADVGIVGKDVLMEVGGKVYEILDLKIGKCFIALAGPAGEAEKLKAKPNKSIATKYPNITRMYFEEILSESVSIVKLNGSVELAPVLGLSDMIVDVVETGRTLKENGLEVYEKLYDITARLIVNRASLKLKPEVESLIETIERVVKSENNNGT
ncbi:ATP phosphoribosyltransferase [Pseudothermotoga thermarum]|uniref:ATP phosphoribosyltransferase n=1 Tax=Pseudothermotoga thermarum DSM 5069 TaxID=688269 RepID=F7YYR5_9THEM|nr:ATP phosphoribosyltransferase [Pseudothermotoga thermarum]AEH51103.1 ATP phosphoribosyltransferase catalytic subunit [Pseudothermotoga thermarum DSM 5069]